MNGIARDLGVGPRRVAVRLAFTVAVILGSHATAAAQSSQPTVQFSSATYSVNENGGAAVITVTLSAPSNQTVTVDYATSDGPPPNGATAPSDYLPANGTLTFPPQSTSQSFSVTIVDDSLPEPSEVVNLSLSNPTNATLGTPSTATLTILDDDPLSVQITKDGTYVGAGLDQDPINLQANPTPDPLPGASYAWSVDTGPGDGVFSAPSAQNTEFRGSAEGDATVKVVLTYQSLTAQDTTPVGIIRIDNIDDAAEQVMDQPDVDLDSPYTISYGGTLRSVLIGAVDDSEEPYLWDTDYTGSVDHQTGDVTLVFSRPGPYLLQINRQNGNNPVTTQYIQVLAGGAAPSGGRGRPVQRVMAMPAIANPSPGFGDLILISTATPPADNGFDGNSRVKLPQVVPPPNAARNVVHVGTVAAGVAAINAKFAAMGNRPFTLVVIGHGAPAQIEMGGGMNPGAGAGLFAAEIPVVGSGTRTFTAACNGKVSSAYLFGCQVSAGAAGTQFLRDLAVQGNHPVGAWNVVVFSWPPAPRVPLAATFGVTRGGVLIVRRPGPGG
jgi:hypothetical protein